MKIKYAACNLLTIIFLATSLSCPAAASALIKSVDFKDARLENAVKLLQRTYNMNVVLHASPQELSQIPGITLSLREIPPYALIKYLCLVTGMNFKIEGDLVIIARNIERTLPYRPDKFKKDPLKDIPSGTSMNVGSTYYVPESYNPPTTITSGNTTIFKPATPKSFRKMQTGTSMGQGPSQAARPQTMAQGPQAPSGPVELEWKQPYPDLKMVNRLRNISDVSVDVDDTPLAQVVDRLRRVTVKQDPRRGGINFIIKPFPGMDTLKVTCYFNNLNMLDTLKYICKAAGVKYQLDRHAVIIYKDARQ